MGEQRHDERKRGGTKEEHGCTKVSQVHKQREACKRPVDMDALKVQTSQPKPNETYSTIKQDALETPYEYNFVYEPCKTNEPHLCRKTCCI